MGIEYNWCEYDPERHVVRCNTTAGYYGDANSKSPNRIAVRVEYDLVLPTVEELADPKVAKRFWESLGNAWSANRTKGTLMGAACTVESKADAKWVQELDPIPALQHTRFYCRDSYRTPTARVKKVLTAAEQVQALLKQLGSPKAVIKMLEKEAAKLEK